MVIATIVIYVIFAFLFGPLWPIGMFARGKWLGKIVVTAWIALAYYSAWLLWR